MSVEYCLVCKTCVASTWCWDNKGNIYVDNIRLAISHVNAGHDVVIMSHSQAYDEGYTVDKFGEDI